jgi:hypothetical protein
VGPCLSVTRQMVPDYRETRLSKIIQEKSLSQPIQFPVCETNKEVSLDDFQSECVAVAVAVSQPLVIRGLPMIERRSPCSAPCSTLLENMSSTGADRDGLHDGK